MAKIKTIGQTGNSRYSDEDLAVFRNVIMRKIDEAESDLTALKEALSNSGSNGTDDTNPSFREIEDLADVYSREEIAALLLRRQRTITELKNALVRIENKTYGICSRTGQLIPRERLMMVPGTTVSLIAA